MKRLCEALASRTLTFAVLTVTLALGGLAAPLAAGAQGPTKVWRIGLFHVGLDHVPPSLAPLREGLRRWGTKRGRIFVSTGETCPMRRRLARPRKNSFRIEWTSSWR